MSLIRKAKTELEQALKDITKQEFIQLEKPKTLGFGDLTSNVAMVLASQQKQSPQQLAENLVSELHKLTFINDICEDIKVVAPGFINFYLKTDLVKQELKFILNTELYGSSEAGNGQTVVLEYSSPNTNKPLHVGHLRNNALGMFLARGLEFTGFNVVKTQVINDRGVHIMKSMLAYEYWGNGITPEDTNQKGDKFVGDYYVKFNQELKNNATLDNEAQDMLVKWEAGDADVRALWAKLNNWVYVGWGDTYKRFGSEFDKNYYESELYTHGREIITEALEKGMVYKNSDGAVAVDLTTEGLGGRDSGEKILLRANGTSVYITQDIYLAKHRFDDYKFHQMIYVVGDEQIYHFKVLFTILKKLGFPWVENISHYSYGHILLPDGKMKSREGTVVDGDDLINEMRVMTEKEITKRQPDLNKNKIEHIATTIANASIKYWFLKNNQKTEIIFDPKQSLDFEGNTGSYLLYTYVRLGSIWSKSGISESDIKFDINNLEPNEIEILRILMQWPEVVDNFIDKMQANFVCDYLFALASNLNSYYHQVNILQANESQRQVRLSLLLAARKVMKLGLDMLNIQTVEKM